MEELIYLESTVSETRERYRVVRAQRSGETIHNLDLIDMLHQVKTDHLRAQKEQKTSR